MLRLSPGDLSSVSEPAVRSSARRVNLEAQPFPGPRQNETNRPWEELPGWPARWIRPQTQQPGPFVAGYRLDFEVQQPRACRIHVSGDERYELFLDGKRISTGTARAPRGWWYYETVAFNPQPGPLKTADLIMAHPRGAIGVAWGPNQSPHITVPEGVVWE